MGILIAWLVGIPFAVLIIAYIAKELTGDDWFGIEIGVLGSLAWPLLPFVGIMFLLAWAGVKIHHATRKEKKEEN